MKKASVEFGAITIVLAAGLWPLVVLAETVYRCPPGNVYQQEPCDRGFKLEMDPKMNMIGTAPSPSRLYLSEISSSETSGPWVATLPMPPRMISTPPQNTPFLRRGDVIRIPHALYGRSHPYHDKHQRRR